MILTNACSTLLTPKFTLSCGGHTFGLRKNAMSESGWKTASPVRSTKHDRTQCMDFQGQGKALTGETEALALIDPTSRYVVVIPLQNREATTWLQPFLDRIIFTFGVPDVLHSDAAPEFLSEALELLAQAADIRTTTTLAHNTRGNGTIEVF